VDLYPTVCDLLGISVPARVSGRSFAGLLDDPGEQHRELVSSFLESKAVHEVGADERTPFTRGMMIRSYTWKLNLYSDDSGELYHVASDRDELRNRFDDEDVREVQLELTGMLARRSLELVRDPTLWQLNQFAG
jgi:arylsulfatase A-like enzyme